VRSSHEKQSGFPKPAEAARRRRYARARAFLLALLAVATMIVLSRPREGTAGTPVRVFVFATTEIRPHALEREIAATLPGIHVRVFGRARELEAAVKQESPEAVLARPVVLKTLGRAPTLKGMKNGKSGEPYVLVSIKRALKPSELGDQPVGAVDLVGRREMKDFVSSVLGVPAPKLKLVTTEHDLLPLLQFGEAVAVLMPARWVGVLRSKSNLDLQVTPLANTVELPALSSASETARTAVEPKVKSWRPELNARLGVDEWK